MAKGKTKMATTGTQQQLTSGGLEGILWYDFQNYIVPHVRRFFVDVVSGKVQGGGMKAAGIGGANINRTSTKKRSHKRARTKSTAANTNAPMTTSAQLAQGGGTKKKPGRPRKGAANLGAQGNIAQASV